MDTKKAAEAAALLALGPGTDVSVCKTSLL